KCLAVSGRDVDKVDATVESSSHRLDAFIDVNLVKNGAERRRAKTEHRNLHAGISKFAVFHCWRKPSLSRHLYARALTKRQANHSRCSRISRGEGRVLTSGPLSTAPFEGVRLARPARQPERLRMCWSPFSSGRTALTGFNAI